MSLNTVTERESTVEVQSRYDVKPALGCQMLKRFSTAPGLGKAAELVGTGVAMLHLSQQLLQQCICFTVAAFFAALSWLPAACTLSTC